MAVLVLMYFATFEILYPIRCGDECTEEEVVKRMKTSLRLLYSLLLLKTLTG